MCIIDRNAALKKILVTITFDQSTAQGWTGGGGSIGYSTDGEWQQVDFEGAFVDGQKNTATIEVEIPKGINPTFDEGSIVQVGWWWGTTASITVDKVAFVFEQPGEKEISITVNEDAPMVATKAGESIVSLAKFVAEVAKVDKIELHMAATGKFKANVYALLLDEGEIPLMAENRVKLGEIGMDDAEGGYETFAFDRLEGTLAGDIIIEVTQIEEGASVVLDAVSLFAADDEELTPAIPEDNEEAGEDGEDIGEEDGDSNGDGDDADVDDEDRDEDENGEDDRDTDEEDREDVGEDDGENTGDEDTGNDEDAGSDSGKESADDGKLPKTGLLDSTYFYILGLAIAAAGAMLMLKRRRDMNA